MRLMDSRETKVTCLLEDGTRLEFKARCFSIESRYEAVQLNSTLLDAPTYLPGTTETEIRFKVRGHLTTYDATTSTPPLETEKEKFAHSISNGLWFELSQYRDWLLDLNEDRLASGYSRILLSKPLPVRALNGFAWRRRSMAYTRETHDILRQRNWTHAEDLHAAFRRLAIAYVLTNTVLPELEIFRILNDV